ncbi:MAG TPA: SAF domain-containing protein [Solirubrobacteraceae bacterium]|jgi:Flp pilus assembly protein CpaB|nr:SAF domain-containing protein [Solirubrobacteraceae bacterium]
MEASGHFGRLGSRRPNQGLGSRKNAIAIAAASAVLAGVLIYLFVSHYNKTTTNTVAAPTEMTVFVAKQYVPAGTPASAVASEALLKSTQVATTQAIAGAITDPSQIVGEVSAAPIAAGQQVTAGDFTRGNVTIGSYLTGDYRAIAVQLDSWHGLTTYLQKGDTVDVMGQKGQASEMLFQKITVLGDQSGNVVLELTDKQSLMLAADVGAGIQLWLTMRPTVGGADSVKAGLVVKP